MQLQHQIISAAREVDVPLAVAELLVGVEDDGLAPEKIGRDSPAQHRRSHALVPAHEYAVRVARRFLREGGLMGSTLL